MPGKTESAIEAGNAKNRLTQAERRSRSDKRLIATGMKLIGARGSAATSMAEIGLTAGFSRGLLNERFGTKQNFLIAMVDQIDRWFQEKLRDRLEGRQGLDAVRARIVAHLDGAQEHPAALRSLYFLMTESLTVEPEILPRINKLEEGFRQGVIAHLNEAKEAGEIPADIDCRQHAIIIVGMIRGLIHQAMQSGGRMDLDWSKEPLTGWIDMILKAKGKADPVWPAI